MEKAVDFMQSRRLVRAIPFVALWLAALAIMYRHNYVFDYRTVTREIDPVTSLRNGLPFVTAEVLVLYLILRPNTFRYSLGRSLVAFGLCAAWTAFSGLFVVHSPGWYLAHLSWLFAVTFGLLLVLLVCLVARIRVRRGKRAE